MNEKKTRRRSEFRRAESVSGSRNEAKLKNKKKRRAILKARRRALALCLAAACCVGIVVVLALQGAFDPMAEETTLTVRSGGDLMFEEVAAVESDTSKQEVVSYAQEQVRAYNEKIGERSVRFKKCSVSDGQVYLKTMYKDAATYADFTGLTCFCGTVEDAGEAGYLFNETFVGVADGKKGKKVSKSDVKKDGDRQVLILSQPISVAVPSDVVYLTRSETKLTSPRSVRIENPTETYIIY